MWERNNQDPTSAAGTDCAPWLLRRSWWHSWRHYDSLPVRLEHSNTRNLWEDAKRTDDLPGSAANTFTAGNRDSEGTTRSTTIMSDSFSDFVLVDGIEDEEATNSSNSAVLVDALPPDVPEQVSSEVSSQASSVVRGVSTIHFQEPNSTAVDNFEVISLGGSPMRTCPTCTLHNSQEARFCTCCGAGLVANPCLDADAQLARRIQQEQEEEIYQTQRLSKSCTFQLGADLLASEILCYLQSLKSPYGFTPVPVELLRHHLAHFLKCHEEALRSIRRHSVYILFQKQWNDARYLSEWF